MPTPDRPDGSEDKFLERMSRELAGWDNPVLRMRQALERDEFVLYCQPILALQGSERFPLAEVLIRLREEEKGLLPPGDFLPVFEHYRMMPQLDRWVVRQTVRRLAQGSRMPCFTINVSSQTLDDVEFPPFIARQVMTAGVPASALVFEIDEHDALTRLPAAERFATAIRAIGGATLIDGFGHRLVSFAPLKRLQVRFVKLDGRIVRKILASPLAEAKTRAVLRVGAALGIEVIAECVEEQDILLRLKALGAAYVQGFGVFQAHPIERIAAGGALPA